MAIDLTTLFNKLGGIGTTLDEVNTQRGTTVPADVTTLYGIYSGSSDEATIDGFMATLTSWQGATGSILTGLQSLASQTVINTVNTDVLQPDKSLSTAMANLIAQMVAQSATVNHSVVGISGTANGSNDGNPSLVYSVKASNGLALENLIPEMIVGTCNSDAQTGGATAGSESITFLGQFAQSDPLSFLYPQGSGSALNVAAVDASLAAPGGSSQWLTNGDMEAFTVSNVPDGWTIVTGSAGTQVVESNVAYTGDHSVGFVGDSSSLTNLQQQFGVDNPNGVVPLTQYSVNLWLKADVVPASGVFEIALVDSTGTIIEDQQGVMNHATKNLTTLTTSFAPFSAVFRLPRLLPSEVHLRLRFSTACPTGSTVFLDRVGFAPMSQVYQGGPYVTVFSGSENLIQGDSFTVTTTNTPGLFQRLFQRLFNMTSLQMILPSSGSPTISDY